MESKMKDPGNADLFFPGGERRAPSRSDASIHFEAVRDGLARAIAAGGIPIFSDRSTIWALTPGLVMESARFVWTNPGEMPVTRSLSPASCRNASVIVRTAFFVAAYTAMVGVI